MQLYLPWQISKGAILYKDIAWLYGPLSQYLHALLFYLWGPSVHLLLAVNLGLFAVFCTLLYYFFQKQFDALTATIAVLCLYVVAGFAALTEVGNFNFLFPYAHEATHGLILLVVATLVMAKPFGAEISGIHAAKLAFVVFCLALAWCTKVEIAITSAALLSLMFVTFIVRKQYAWAFRLMALTLCFAALLALAWRVLLGHEFMWDGVFGSVAPLFQGGRSFIVNRLAFDAVEISWLSAAHAVSQAAILVVTLVVLALLDWICSQRQQLKLWVLFLWLLCLAGAFSSLSPFFWFELLKGVPFLFLLLWGLLIFRKDISFFAVVWLVLSLGLAARLGFQFRVQHYGFYMSIPMLLGMIMILLHHLPHLAARCWRGGFILRYGALTFLLAGFSILAVVSSTVVSARTYVYGQGVNSIHILDPQFSFESRVLVDSSASIQALEKNAQTLLVLPSGTGLNYFLGILNPTQFPWFSEELRELGFQEPFLRAFQSKMPDWLLLLKAPEVHTWPKWYELLEPLVAAHYSEVRHWEAGGVVGARLFVRRD
jgi:hypothetical protein